MLTMSRTPLVFYGAGHLGRQIYHHVKHYCAETAQVLGFIDDTKGVGHEVIDGQLTLGSLADAMQDPALQPTAVHLVFAIGYTSMVQRRAALERVLAAGYPLFTVVHPRAVIEPGAEVGAGCVVLAGAVIDQQVKVGAACFIDINVRLTAGTLVGCNNYFSSGTATGSRVQIGDDCFFGMDCTVTTDVKMGSHLFVNAKTLVPRDVGDNLKLVQVQKSRELLHPRR
jgi:acetyltransferase-like isoleucine patch superfamily enzyme